jgi:hypothetical protein
VLLHDTVTNALASHRIQRDGDGPGVGGTAIATFAGPAGERLTLVRVADPTQTAGEQPTTLEEVVLGYLASGRALPGDAARPAA